MGCGCNSAKNKQKYEVITADGRRIEVDSRTQALATVRKEGGKWGPVKSDK